MALSAQAALLDELMGKNRNAAPGDRVKNYHFSDPDICKHFLCGFCPHELFVNTRADLGPCEKIHDENLKKQYEKSSRKGRIGYEDEFEIVLRSLLSDVEKRIKKGRDRLSLTQGTDDKFSSVRQDRIQALNEQINALISEADQLGREGNVDAAKESLDKCERLKIERLDLETRHTSENTKAMEVCNVCGSFLIVGDAQCRVEEHITGKQHVGFAKIRSTLEQLRADREKSAEERRKAREQERNKLSETKKVNTEHLSSRHRSCSLRRQRSSHNSSGAHRSPPSIALASPHHHNTTQRNSHHSFQSGSYTSHKVTSNPVNDNNRSNRKNVMEKYSCERDVAVPVRSTKPLEVLPGGRSKPEKRRPHSISPSSNSHQRKKELKSKRNEDGSLQSHNYISSSNSNKTHGNRHGDRHGEYRAYRGRSHSNDRQSNNRVISAGSSKCVSQLDRQLKRNYSTDTQEASCSSISNSKNIESTISTMRITGKDKRPDDSCLSKRKRSNRLYSDDDKLTNIRSRDQHHHHHHESKDDNVNDNVRKELKHSKSKHHSRRHHHRHHHHRHNRRRSTSNTQSDCSASSTSSKSDSAGFREYDRMRMKSKRKIVRNLDARQSCSPISSRSSSSNDEKMDRSN